MEAHASSTMNSMYGRKARLHVSESDDEDEDLINDGYSSSSRTELKQAQGSDAASAVAAEPTDDDLTAWADAHEENLKLKYTCATQSQGVCEKLSSLSIHVPSAFRQHAATAMRDDDAGGSPLSGSDSVRTGNPSPSAEEVALGGAAAALPAQTQVLMTDGAAAESPAPPPIRISRGMKVKKDVMPTEVAVRNIAPFLRRNLNSFETLNAGVDAKHCLFADSDGRADPNLTPTEFYALTDNILRAIKARFPGCAVTSSCKFNYQKPTAPGEKAALPYHKLSVGVVDQSMHGTLPQLKHHVQNAFFPALKDTLKDIIPVVLKGTPEADDPMLKQFIDVDLCVYRHGKMRCVLSSKDDEDRPKVLYGEDPTDAALLRTIITYIPPGSEPLPPLEDSGDASIGPRTTARHTRVPSGGDADICLADPVKRRLEQFIQQKMGLSGGGVAPTPNYASTTVSRVSEHSDSMLCVSINGSRYCAKVEREHTGNNVYFTFGKTGRVRQKCHGCKDYSSPSVNLPEDLRSLLFQSPPAPPAAPGSTEAEAEATLQANNQKMQEAAHLIEVHPKLKLHSDSLLPPEPYSATHCGFLSTSPACPHNAAAETPGDHGLHIIVRLNDLHYLVKCKNKECQAKDRPRVYHVLQKQAAAKQLAGTKRPRRDETVDADAAAEIDDEHACKTLIVAAKDQVFRDGDKTFVRSSLTGMHESSVIAHRAKVMEHKKRLLFKDVRPNGATFTVNYGGQLPMIDRLLKLLPSCLPDTDALSLRGGESRGKFLFQDGVDDWETGEFVEGLDHPSNASIMFCARIKRKYVPRSEVDEDAMQEVDQTLFKDPYALDSDDVEGLAVGLSVKKHLAMALFGSWERKRMPSVIGPPDCGKSLMADCLKAAFGGYVGTFLAASLVDNAFNGHDAERKDSFMVELFESGCRLAIAEEIKGDKKAVYSTDVMKRFVGFDLIKGRRIFGDTKEFKMHLTPVMFGNVVPAWSPPLSEDAAAAERFEPSHTAICRFVKPTQLDPSKPHLKQAMSDAKQRFLEPKYGSAFYHLMRDCVRAMPEEETKFGGSIPLPARVRHNAELLVEVEEGASFGELFDLRFRVTNDFDDISTTLEVNDHMIAKWSVKISKEEVGRRVRELIDDAGWTEEQKASLKKTGKLGQGPADKVVSLMYVNHKFQTVYHGVVSLAELDRRGAATAAKHAAIAANQAAAQTDALGSDYGYGAGSN